MMVFASIVYERGYRATRLRDVADRAGVSLTTLTDCWPTEIDWLLETAATSADRLYGRMADASMRAPHDPAHALHHALSTMLCDLAAAPELVYLSVIELARPRPARPRPRRPPPWTLLAPSLTAASLLLNRSPPARRPPHAAYPRGAVGDQSSATPSTVASMNFPTDCPPSATSAFSTLFPASSQSATCQWLTRHALGPVSLTGQRSAADVEPVAERCRARRAAGAVALVPGRERDVGRDAVRQWHPAVVVQPTIEERPEWERIGQEAEVVLRSGTP